jgi:hypothetical protein
MASFSEEIPRRVNVHRNQPLQPMISISIIRHQINLNALWKGDRSVVAKFPNSSSPLRLCRGLPMAPPVGLVPWRPAPSRRRRTCRLGLRPELAGRRGCVGGGPRAGGREPSGSPSSTARTRRPRLAVGDEGRRGPSCESGRTGARGRGRSLCTLGTVVWARWPEELLAPAAPQARLPERMREGRGAREGGKLPGAVGATPSGGGKGGGAREGGRARRRRHTGSMETEWFLPSAILVVSFRIGTSVDTVSP